MKKYAPIALFAYNRLEHLKKTVESLSRNELAPESDFIAFSDGARREQDREKVSKVREYLRSVTGFKSVRIVERSENLGLARSIISGVTEIVDSFGTVIVMEDDLVSSPYFLRFVNDGLEKYENRKRVIEIHGYQYPIKHDLPETYFISGADCLGWATWRDRWKGYFVEDGTKLLSELKRKNLTERFDLNGAYPYTQMLIDQIQGKNNSWAVRWHASAVVNGLLTLYPGRSLIRHIGMDSSGSNCGSEDFLEVQVYEGRIAVGDIAVEEDALALSYLEEFLRNRYPQSQRPGVLKRAADRLKRLVKTVLGRQG